MKIFLSAITIVSAIGSHAFGQLHSQHGFVIVGEKGHSIYHLSKFNSPHQYQAIARIEVFLPNGSLLNFSKLRRDLKLKEGSLISFLSEETFALKDRFKVGQSMTGKLFAGYLRDTSRIGRKLILDQVIVKLTEVVHFREIISTHWPLKDSNFLTWCLDGVTFGIAKMVTGAPSFEQVAEVRLHPAQGTNSFSCADAFSKISLLTLKDSRTDEHPFGTSATAIWQSANRKNTVEDVLIEMVNPVFMDYVAINPAPPTGGGPHH